MIFDCVNCCLGNKPEQLSEGEGILNASIPAMKIREWVVHWGHVNERHDLKNSITIEAMLFKTVFIYVCVCCCVCVHAHTHEGVTVHVWKSEDHLMGVSSLLPPCGSKDSNSGCQAWWRAPVPLKHPDGLNGRGLLID